MTLNLDSIISINPMRLAAIRASFSKCIRLRKKSIKKGTNKRNGSNSCSIRTKKTNNVFKSNPKNNHKTVKRQKKLNKCKKHSKKKQRNRKNRVQT